MAPSSDSDGPLIDENIIRIQLRKPCHRKWELRTRNHSPSIKFPTIQLFDCEGNLLVETNDDNISIKSSDFDECTLRPTQSLKEKDFRHIIGKPLKKHNTIAHGDKVYTRIYKHKPVLKDTNKNFNKSFIIKDSNGITHIPVRISPLNNLQQNFQANSLESVRLTSEGVSEASSYKSSDNENCNEKKNDLHTKSTNKFSKSTRKNSITSQGERDRSLENSSDKENESFSGIHKSQSFNDSTLKRANGYSNIVERSKSSITYKPPHNKISFLNTYSKSLPTRSRANPNWLAQLQRAQKRSTEQYSMSTEENTSENDFINVPTDVAAYCEMKIRLKMYRRGISEIEVRRMVKAFSPQKRRHSESGALQGADSSSSESVDEADVVLNRLKRRILRNKFRDKRRTSGAKFLLCQPRTERDCSQHSSDSQRHEFGGAFVRSRPAMGSNISQHSSKGLKGRRARSSGDLCNGDTKSQTETSVCGSVVGDIGWNRSLPNHLDGNRHLADYSRVNNNYAEFATYNRCHPKGGRGLRYRVSKSGSNADPVWKLQDPGFDQGYGSERSPEDDYVPPIVQIPPVSMDQYETELRTVYPFINDENTFTVVVEKDGRGLGMSVCGGGGLVRIRRLYPPQPAWRTGRLAPKDLLLSANGVPLAGLSTYEALEVLRTAATRVEMRVCRPPPEVLESVTPPDPPTPPARTPHPPQLPPMDPLNCHPLHARLSATTSSATTSSSEGRGRRDASPEAERRDLHLPDLDRHLPVYDVQYGDDGSVEFDIIMAKVNGSLGFTLRKEDHSALGHYVRALVREPALSDGRIQPGDRIVAVNDTPMSNMSHAEAVAFLRSCGSDVRLRLYRDHAATPLSPMSPKEEGPTDSDTPMHRPKPPLRPEAVSMLCDLAARRLTPDTTDGSRSPCLSPRKFRKLTKDNNHYEQPHHHDAPKIKIQFNEPESKQDARRTNSIALASSTLPPTTRKQKLSLTVPPCGYELNNLDNDTLDAPNVYQEDIKQQRFPEPNFPVDSDEPVSMPAELSSDEARFKHMNPTYQSAVLHTTTSDGTSDAHNKDDNGLKKWKGVAALSPDNERKAIKIDPPQLKPAPVESVQKENVNPEPARESVNNEPTIVTVELNRGWNSRLGFSVQSHPDSGQSYISAVYNDSVAARDGRLHTGDVILQVNDENVTSMKTPEVIDLLRLLRGSICITVLRPPPTRH